MKKLFRTSACKAITMFACAIFMLAGAFLYGGMKAEV